MPVWLISVKNKNLRSPIAKGIPVDQGIRLNTLRVLKDDDPLFQLLVQTGFLLKKDRIQRVPVHQCPPVLLHPILKVSFLLAVCPKRSQTVGPPDAKGREVVGRTRGSLHDHPVVGPVDIQHRAWPFYRGLMFFGWINGGLPRVTGQQQESCSYTQ